MKESNDFGKTLKDIRKRRGLTQLTLAKNVGLTSQVISNFERGYTQPNQEHLKNLANALNCKISDLVAYDVEEIDYEKIMFSDKASFDALPKSERERILENLQLQADFMIERAKQQNKQKD